jgi:hypothetical protein
MTNQPPTCDLDTLAMAKFEDMAEQLRYLLSQGQYEEAELLKQEGFDLANELDNGSTFIYLNDLTLS